MKRICLDNIPIFQSVTKPQQTNEHMREVINHLTHIHLLNTIKSILSRLQSSSVHPHDEDQEDVWSQNPMVRIHNNFFTRMMNYGKNFVSSYNLLEQSFLYACATFQPFDGP